MKEPMHTTARLEVSGEASDLTISYTSGHGRDAVILLACMTPPLVAAVLLSPDAGGPYLRATFLSGMAVVCYRTLALALDRTTIRGVGERLTVRRRGPLPWFRGADLDLLSGEVGRFLYAKSPGARGMIGAALRDGRRVILLSGLLRADEAESVIKALRRWLEAVGGQEIFGPDESYGDTPPAAEHHSERAAALSAVAFTSESDGQTIVYKWWTGRKLILIILLTWLLIAEAPLTIAYLELSRFWVDFNLIDYPSFLIISLFLGYCTALLIFNRTTTRITDTIFSVRRGPLPCFWPGDYECPIEDVQQVCFSCHTNPGAGNRVCSVYVITDDGTQLNLSTARNEGSASGGRQFNLFTVGDDDLAFELGTRVQGWIDEKRRKGLGMLYSPSEQPRVHERWWSPPDRARRIKVMFSFLAAFCGVVVLMVGAEYLATFYRPARRARRHEEIYRQFLDKLRSTENYAVAVPTDWRRYSAGFKEPFDAVYQGQQIYLYRGMNETFGDSLEGRIEIKGLDAAEVTGTPCGRGDYFVFPVVRAALKQDSTGTASADTPAFKATSLHLQRIKDDGGGEWVCARNDPRMLGK